MVILTLAQVASDGNTVRINPESIAVTMASIVTMLTAAYGVWRAMSRRGTKSDQFYRDWYGEPERPGVPPRPGTLEKLDSLDRRLVTVDGKVDVIHSEVNYNHGGSIKDAVDRIDTTIKVMDTRLGSVESDIKLIHNRVSGN